MAEFPSQQPPQSIDSGPDGQLILPPVERFLLGLVGYEGLIQLTNGTLSTGRPPTRDMVGEAFKGSLFGSGKKAAETGLPAVSKIRYLGEENARNRKLRERGVNVVDSLRTDLPFHLYLASVFHNSSLGQIEDWVRGQARAVLDQGKLIKETHYDDEETVIYRIKAPIYDLFIQNSPLEENKLRFSFEARGRFVDQMNEAVRLYGLYIRPALLN